MSTRIPLLFLAGMMVGACGGDADDSGAMSDEAAPAPAADASAEAFAAMDAIREGYMEHYNLHHPSMVADYYTDGAVWLGADGTVSDGKEAILATLEGAMGGSPVLGLETQDQIALGDYALSRGVYTVETSPEGMGTMALQGNFMSLFSKENSEWKLAAVLTNYDAPPPDGLPFVPFPPADVPPDVTDSPVSGLAQSWAQHYNLHHASMVADLHTVDGVTMWAGSPLTVGRPAIETATAEAMAASPETTLHEVNVRDLGDGHYLSLGWYEMSLTTPDGPMAQQGAYMVLSRVDEDGTMRLHWGISNGQPAM